MKRGIVESCRQRGGTPGSLERSLGRARRPFEVGQMAEGHAEPPVVAELGGERLSLAHAGRQLRELPERHQPITELDADVDRDLQGGARAG